MHAAAWLTVTLFPATRTVALRLPALLAVTDTTAVPDPVRLPVTVAQGDEDAEFHAQADVVVTVTDAVEAELEKLNEVGDTV